MEGDKISEFAWQWIFYTKLHDQLIDHRFGTNTFRHGLQFLTRKSKIFLPPSRADFLANIQGKVSITSEIGGNCFLSERVWYPSA